MNENERPLTTEEVAKRYSESKRTIHERARRGLIPHRRIGGTRRLIFKESELVLYEDGCELETIETARGGRMVRPVVTK